MTFLFFDAGARQRQVELAVMGVPLHTRLLQSCIDGQQLIESGRDGTRFQT
ncbi:MAG: hypothetical protein ACRDIV_05470 [Ktedonobacteraceae bacterium]